VSGPRGEHADAFERCMAVGGVAVFPADTVYGLACDPGNRVAVERLYLLKRRPLDKPSAVMFFDVSLALEALGGERELGQRTRAALSRLLPGPVSVLLPNPRGRFPLACGSDPGTLGLRVPVVPALAGVSWPVLQSSANLAGGPDPRRLADVPELLRRAADIVIDAGELPGTPSTVVDLRAFEADASWSIVRAGGMSEADVAAALRWQFHFDPATYAAMIREEIPVYELLQEQLVLASGSGARRILELGTGTGETARRLLERHPEASLVGVDASPSMLEQAARTLPGARVRLQQGAIEEPLPPGPFDLVASALCLHHVEGVGKREVFASVLDSLRRGGRFVLADVVEPDDPADAVIDLTPGYDHPSPLSDQLRWLAEAGFVDVSVVWAQRDLAVVLARAPA
jgi:L-threonylcarbamoyladenylate synthase